MKKKLLCCFGLLFILVYGNAQNRETDVFLKRYKDFLFMTDSSFGSIKNIPPINKEGRWSDIDYTDDQPGGWQLGTHMRRIKTMALGWSAEKASDYHSTEILQTISLALNDWFKHRYKSKNWWHNEIGIPQLMRDIIILMRDSLDKQQVEQCLQILRQHKVKGTGANLVWSADLGMHYGALTNDTVLMRRCRDTILTVIKISVEEGVQPDFSFHQHGKRLQMYHYGGAFLLDDVRLAWQLSGLPLAFPPEKIQVLTDFVLKGWQWMARGINTVPGTIDRAASRRNALHSADIRKIIPLMYEVQPDSINAFKKMLEIQKGNDALVGYRYYPYSNFTSFQQQQYSFFLKTNSTRTLLTESINEENLKGDLLNSGDAYFISDGTEYYNLMPFWDWDRLPGITNFISQGKNEILSQSFVGNASNGKSGMSVMDYALKNNEQSLRAKKFWASWKNITVALIAGLETSHLSAPAFTVLDQSRWQGKVTVDQKNNLLKEGQHTFSSLRWIHHRNFAYIPLEKDSITIDVKNVNARWYDINHSESSATIQDKIFLPSIIHRNASTGYVVAYAPSVRKASQIVKKKSWKVLRNDSICQAVSFGDGTLMAAIYKEEKLSLTPTLSIIVSQPCLVLMEGEKVFVSDPQHEGGKLVLMINNKEWTVDLPDDGTTIEAFR